MIEIPNPNPINNKNNVNLNTYIFLIEVIKMEEFIENKESNKMKMTTRTTRNNSDKMGSVLDNSNSHRCIEKQSTDIVCYTQTKNSVMNLCNKVAT